MHTVPRMGLTEEPAHVWEISELPPLEAPVPGRVSQPMSDPHPATRPTG